MDFEKRLSEKDDEMENMRKNAQRTVVSIQKTLDGEKKSRAEVLRQKKNLKVIFRHSKKVFETGTENKEAEAELKPEVKSEDMFKVMSEEMAEAITEAKLEDKLEAKPEVEA